MNSVTYPSDVMKSILESEGLYANDEEKEVCKCLVQELTKEEQELAAQSSYAYWLYSSRRQQEDEKNDQDERSGESDDKRLRMAMREARRHLVAENGDYRQALDRVRASCVFRKDYRFDIIRTLFDSKFDNPDASNSIDETANDDDTSPNRLRTLYRNYVTQELQIQAMVVRGKDRSNRAVVVKLPRESSDMNVDAYVITHAYLAERALAATEYLSRGKDEKVTAVFDFGTYSSRNSPTVTAIRRLVSALQQHYPERLKYLVVVDPPLWMRGLINIIYPFLSSDTKEKIRLVSGEAQRQSILSELIATEQAMPFMLPGGKLEAPVDVNQFLYHVPFHSLYDDAE